MFFRFSISVGKSTGINISRIVGLESRNFISRISRRRRSSLSRKPRSFEQASFRLFSPSDLASGNLKFDMCVWSHVPCHTTCGHLMPHATHVATTCRPHADYQHCPVSRNPCVHSASSEDNNNVCTCMFTISRPSEHILSTEDRKLQNRTGCELTCIDAPFGQSRFILVSRPPSCSTGQTNQL